MTTSQNQRLQICSYHKYGHCKLGVECEKYHSKKVCKDINCDVKSCNDRHPRPCTFYSLGVCKFSKDCSFSHKKVEDINSLRKELTELRSKYGSAIQQVEKQDKIINVLRDQVNNLQGEVINILKNMSEIEELKGQGRVDVEMDVDGENLKASQNIDVVDNLKASQNVQSLREVTWEEGEDETYKEFLYFEKDIAKKVRDELKNINKNLKKRSIDETKGKMGKLGIWLNEKGMEVEKMAEKDMNHKDKFDNDNEFKEMLAEMNNVLSAMELSTKKDKTRKILEDNLKNMIEGSNIVLMNKCADIWGIFDEMQDELNATTVGL